MELDVTIPSLNLAFEYQGIQHEEPIARYGGQASFDAIVERDKEKLESATAKGIKVIYVTDRWDGRAQSIFDMLVEAKFLSTEDVGRLKHLAGDFPPDPYQRVDEFKEALNRLGIVSTDQFFKRYTEDPRLNSNPVRFYSSFEGDLWCYVFDREPKAFYETAGQALAAARVLGIKTPKDYKRNFKLDALLPASPNRVYGIEGGLKVFLGTVKRYYNLCEAMVAVKQLNIRNHPEYRKRYQEDERLPSNPERHYKGESEWINANVFFGNRPEVFYTTYDEAKAAVERLGISTKEEYAKNYAKDLKLPSSPVIIYAESWTSWRAFCQRQEE